MISRSRRSDFETLSLALQEEPMGPAFHCGPVDHGQKQKVHRSQRKRASSQNVSVHPRSQSENRREALPWSE